MSNFDTIIEKLTFFKSSEIPRLVAEVEKIRDLFSLFKPFVKEFSIKNDFKFTENWRISAVDGGCDSTNLEGVAFAVSSARSFTTTTSPSSFKEYMEFDMFDAPSDTTSQIVSTMNMKNLEAKVAKKALIDQLENDSGYNHLFLFDGSFSFPDDSVGKTNIIELKKAFREYCNSFNDFFKLAKKHEIDVIAIAKDNRSAKYLRSFKNDKKFSKLNDKQKYELTKMIKHQSYKERIGFQGIFRDLSNETALILDPIKLNEKKITKGEVPISILRNDGYWGTYYMYPNASNAYYLEFPKWTMSKFNELLPIIFYLSRVSPVLGYPYPLVYADKMTRMSKNFSSKIFTQLMIDFRTLYPKLSRDLINPSMREKLH